LYLYENLYRSKRGWRGAFPKLLTCKRSEEMKKFLAAAVAFGMVAGVAATASALELKVKGKYVADGLYINSGNGAAGGWGVAPWDLEASVRAASNLGLDALEPKSDTWYQHTFRFDPTLIINDKVQIKSDIRLVDSNSVWGNQKIAYLDGAGNVTRTKAGDLNRFNGDGLRVNKLWMTYDSPVGKFEIGRRPAGAWMNGFVNSGTAADRIMLWAPKMDNFKGYAFLQKSAERDAYSTFGSDDDNDYYEVAGAYVAEGMNFWLGLGTQQDNGNANIDMWRIKGYGDFVINDGNKLYGEFDWKTGDRGANSSVDIDSAAWIFGWMGNFGNVSPSVHVAYISGQDDSGDATAYSVSKGMGADFEPLYILTGQATNVLNGDRGASMVGTAVRTSGALAVVALADYKVSEDLTLHGGLGWGKADETDWIGPGVDDDYGWELDLGLSYKVYQNLTYDIHFGYWGVGDFAQLGMSDLATEDIVLLSHHLSMKF